MYNMSDCQVVLNDILSCSQTVKSKVLNSPSNWKLNFEFEFPEDGPSKFGTK